MRVAILIVDDRFAHPAAMPVFGAAPTALLQGLSSLFGGSDHPTFSVDVISCTKWRLPAPELLAPGIRFHQLVLPGWSFLRSGYLGPILAVRKLLARLKPDIVHAQGTESWCAAAAIFSPIPKVLTLHGCITLIAQAVRLEPRWYWLPHQMVERAALRRFDAVFCSTNYVKDGVGGRCRAAHLVPNAVREEFLTPRPIRRPCKTPTVLNVGVIQARKRQVGICEVAHRLAAQGLSFRLRFIGRGEADADYVGEFQRHMERGRAYLEYSPEMNTRALVEEMDRAAALIHSPAEEAFGLVAAEALARNLPTFLASVGGLVDIARDVPAARLHANDAELESQLREFLSGSQAAQEISSQKIMASRYSPEVIALRHLAIYSELVHAV